MAELPDYDLLRTDESAPFEPRASHTVVWIAAVLVVVAAAVAAYIVYSRRSVTAPAPAAVATKAPATAGDRPLGGTPEKIDLPPLGESDPIVRELVHRITSHRTALAWLATNGLIRNFAVVVANTAEGTTPARHLRVLQPTGSFQVVQRNGELYIDPQSYGRYDRLAAAAASIDPAGAARVYATLKPRIEEAYGELGVRPPSFDQALERAIVTLLRTPAVDGAVRADAKGIGYRFTDPRLENLTAAQKQLLRTGPHNVQLIQSSLRDIAIALGIPAERLP